MAKSSVAKWLPHRWMVVKRIVPNVEGRTGWGVRSLKNAKMLLVLWLDARKLGVHQRGMGADKIRRVSNHFWCHKFRLQQFYVRPNGIS